jgi:hypothetical protein
VRGRQLPVRCAMLAHYLHWQCLIISTCMPDEREADGNAVQQGQFLTGKGCCRCGISLQDTHSAAEAPAKPTSAAYAAHVLCPVTVLRSHASRDKLFLANKATATSINIERSANKYGCGGRYTKHTRGYTRIRLHLCAGIAEQGHICDDTRTTVVHQARRRSAWHARGFQGAKQGSLGGQHRTQQAGRHSCQATLVIGCPKECQGAHQTQPAARCSCCLLSMPRVFGPHSAAQNQISGTGNQRRLPACAALRQSSCALPKTMSGRG